MRLSRVPEKRCNITYLNLIPNMQLRQKWFISAGYCTSQNEVKTWCIPVSALATQETPTNSPVSHKFACLDTQQVQLFTLHLSLTGIRGEFVTGLQVSLYHYHVVYITLVNLKPLYSPVCVQNEHWDWHQPVYENKCTVFRQIHENNSQKK